MNWKRLYNQMVCRDRWDYEDLYFRSENLKALESIRMLWYILEDI